MNALQNRLGHWLKRNQDARAFQFFSLFRYLGLLLSSIALARLFPDKSLIEEYERLLLLGGSVTFFWVGGLYDAFVVAFKESEKRERKQTLGAASSLALALGLLSSLSVAALGLLIYGDEISTDALLGYAVFTGADSYALLVTYFLVVNKRAGELVIFAIVSYSAYFGLLIIFTRDGDLGAATIALAGLAILKAVYCAFRIDSQEAVPAFNQRSKTLLKIGLPLGLAALLSYSATYLDSYLVEEFFPEDFANFRYGAKELPLVLLLANSLSIVQSGDIAEGLRDQSITEALQRLKAGGKRLMHLLFPISALLLLTSDWLFKFVFGEAFAGAVPVFDIYLLLVIPRLLFPQSLLRGHRLTRLMGISAGIELAANILLSIVGLYFFGMVGIAGATVIAYLLEKAILIGYCKRKLNLNMGSYTPLAWWGLYSSGITAIFVLKFFIL